MSDQKNRNMEYAARAAIIGTVGGMSAAALYADKKPKPKGLKAPTAKTSEKVMIRGIKNMPDLVSENKAKAFTRTYEHHTKRHGMSKKLARIGSKAANESNFSFKARTMGKAFVGGFAEGMNKVRRITAAGVAAEILKPTPVGDATMDGKKYTNYKMTLNK